MELMDGGTLESLRSTVTEQRLVGAVHRLLVSLWRQQSTKLLNSSEHPSDVFGWLESALGRESLEPSSAKPLTNSVRGLLFSGRVFCSESGDNRSSSGCWNCGFSSEKSAFLFCESCRSIQPVDDSVDYFQIFGLEKKYGIDAGSLEGKYKDWQKKLHPDLVHNKSKKEREYAVDQSAKVTEAMRTLTRKQSTKLLKSKKHTHKICLIIQSIKSIAEIFVLWCEFGKT